MGKASRRANRPVGTSTKVSTNLVDPTRSRIPWFAISIGAVVAVGTAVVFVLAEQRQTVAGIAPEAFKDHWHDSLSIYACDQWLPPTTDTEHGNGIHSHADGLIHIHPASTAAAGPNATLGEFLETAGATLNDDQYLPGRGEVPTVLDETAGCGDRPAELVLGVWSADDMAAEPEIIRSELADFRFRRDGEILTLALLPQGEAVPQSPAASQVNNPVDLP